VFGAKCIWAKYVKTCQLIGVTQVLNKNFLLTMSGLMSFFFFVFLLPAAEVADELLVPELDRDRNSKL